MTAVKTIQLLPIDQKGEAPLAMDRLPDMMRENCSATASFYGVVGFEPPWIGYMVVAEGRPVGGGGFKGAPQDNRVEIAYYTLPDHEGQGFASATAAALVDIARKAMPSVVVAAQTLPAPNASNTLLKKLGFRFAGSVFHPEDGEVWEWQLGPPRSGSSTIDTMGA
jgi:[ribosomal protein S5]-alanine N-acetyltransferase